MKCRLLPCSHLCTCISCPQQTRAGDVHLHLVNSCVFSFLLCRSGWGKHACISISCNALSLYVFSCEVDVQIMSNKGCYLKAPTLHCVSKSLLFGAFAQREAATGGARCTDPKPSLNPFVQAAGWDRSRLLRALLCQPWGPSTGQGAVLHPHRDSSPLC